jgi:hypothetical protein
MFKAMKKIILIGCLLIASASFYKADAQVKINININSQPEWGPVGYDHVEYYYLPDVQSYYYVPTHQYVYLSNGKWIFASALPPIYSTYNIYNGYKVVVNEPKAYMRFNEHKVQYAKYKGWQGKQPMIKESKDDKYKNHWHDNGNHNGQKKEYHNNGNGKKHN